MKTTADGHLLQISPLTKDEDGSYECHASNIQGEASAVGTIHVVDSINDIPPKKGEWVQLNGGWLMYNKSVHSHLLHASGYIKDMH